MSYIDKRRITDVKETLGYTFTGDEWIAPLDATPSPNSTRREAIIYVMRAAVILTALFFATLGFFSVFPPDHWRW